MRRLVASDLLPERAGQPVRAWVHLSLADLLLLDGDSALQEQWTARVRQRWAACRAFAAETGSEGGAWLDGDAAEGVACDAAMAPLVTGEVNVAALEDLVRLCVELDRLRRADGSGRPGGGGRPGTTTAAADTPAPDTAAAWAALEQAVIGKAVDHHRVEQGQDEGPAQPRTARPGRVRAPARPGVSTTSLSAGPGDPMIPSTRSSPRPDPRATVSYETAPWEQPDSSRENQPRASFPTWGAGWQAVRFLEMASLVGPALG